MVVFLNKSKIECLHSLKNYFGREYLKDPLQENLTVWKNEFILLIIWGLVFKDFGFNFFEHNIRTFFSIYSRYGSIALVPTQNKSNIIIMSL